MEYPYQLVIVQWLDSCSGGSWEMAKDRKPTPPLKIMTIGWIIHEDATYIEIAQSWGGEGSGLQTCNTISIPKPCILHQMIVPPMKFGD